MLKKINKLLASLILSPALVIFLFATFAHATESNEEYMFKVAVENHLEERLTQALKGITGTTKLIVLVNAEIDTDIKKIVKKSMENTGGNGASPVLPGVPVKKEIGKESSFAALRSMTTSKITNLNVTVLVDVSVPEEMYDVMRNMAIKAIGYNPDRGDSLIFTQVKFKEKTFDWKSILYPPHLYWLIIIVLGWVLLLAGAYFIMNPFKKLTIAVRNINWENIGALPPGADVQGGAPLPIPIAAPVKAARASRRAAAEPMAGGGSNGSEPMPFSYIEDIHMKELSFLLKDNTPLEVAIVANYLPPELAIKLIEAFPEDQQTDIALHLSSEDEIQQDKVQDLDASIKERLNFIVGGNSKLASILDFTGENLRKRIIEKIESVDAASASALKKKVMSFRSILRDMPEHNIQAIYRHMDPTTFARLLKSSPDDIQTRVLECLSEGAAERMTEEMELSRPFSKDQLKKEKINFIGLVREMIKSGVLEEKS